MRLSSRIGIGLATALLALATTGDAKAQLYGGYGRGYANPYYGAGIGYGNGIGYGPGYSYNRGYSYYGMQPYFVPQTYNNLNGLAGMIGRTVAPRSTYAYPTYRRRRW